MLLSKVKPNQTKKKNTPPPAPQNLENTVTVNVFLLAEYFFTKYLFPRGERIILVFVSCMIDKPWE